MFDKKYTLDELLKMNKLCLSIIQNQSKSQIVILSERRKIKETLNALQKILDNYFMRKRKKNER